MDANRRIVRTQQSRIKSACAHSTATGFFNLLTSDVLLPQVESLLPPHRERLYPPTETLSMFCAQALNTDRSCQHAVDAVAVSRLAHGLTSCSSHTGAFSRARTRLPVDMVSTLARFTGRWVANQANASWHWRNRPVRLVDGTTITLPDTPANQDVYPQSHNQAPGLGFPICRLVGIVCLGSGALLDATISRYQGKGSDEQSMLRALLGTLHRGEILVGDAFYATYFLLCHLIEAGIDGVFEQHGSRRRMTDFRRGERLGERDHVIVLNKPIKQPDWMSREAFDAAPDTLKVRELETGGKTLVTTMLCAKQVSKADLKLLYRDRWHVELDLRAIKTTLGMERLSCVTPSMAVKEMWVYLLSYNLIRMMMARAAAQCGCLPRQLSFKHAVQVCVAAIYAGRLGYRLDDEAALLALIAQRRVGNRAGRVEPRAVKRRPKSYPLLTVPREVARANIRANGHPKRLK
jgi:hypothetical protein